VVALCGKIVKRRIDWNLLLENNRSKQDIFERSIHHVTSRAESPNREGLTLWNKTIIHFITAAI
jgi:hypothetical protein